MAKWSDYIIVAVRYTSTRTHIDSVEVRPDNDVSLGAPSIWSRSQVVTAIENGYTFVTAFLADGRWYQGEDVRIVYIAGSKYIRTDRNSRASDNLENLPEF
jgi:hypothetical protein